MQTGAHDDIDNNDDDDGEEKKMSIVCHYNPIMDEFVSLTDEIDKIEDAKENDDIDLLFDLCKDDFPLSSFEQTVNIGKFLKDLEKTGLLRGDPRLQNLIKLLQEIVDGEGANVSSMEHLCLNKTTFKR